MSRQSLWVVVVVVFTSGLCVSQSSGQVLTGGGPCPGVMVFDVIGGTPFTSYAFIHAQNQGAWVIPTSQVCAGTTTGLAWPIVLAGFVNANGLGDAIAMGNVPANFCNNRYLQVVDTISCTTSNVWLIN